MLKLAQETFTMELLEKNSQDRLVRVYLRLHSWYRYFISNYLSEILLI